jgi:hypothetical protein
VDARVSAERALTAANVDSYDAKFRHIAAAYASASTFVAASHARRGALQESLPKAQGDESKVVDEYATAVALANATGATHPAITHARRRLAQLAIDLGDSTMAALVGAVADPSTPGSRLRYAPGDYTYVGLPLAGQADGAALPLPVLP